MNPHTLFYYPYCSFNDTQAPLLKAAALYFDKLYILDTQKATGGTIGPGPVADDVARLEEVGILERVSPEEVLQRYEPQITEAIRADLADPKFLKICAESGRAPSWRLALAKVPATLRTDPQYQPVEESMRRLMRDVPQGLTPELVQYDETYAESAHSVTQNLSEYLETPIGHIEYRYADYPLPLGESIMVNHALFAGLLHTGAPPLTDDPFHHRVLKHKIKRARQLPEIRQILEDRARQPQIKGPLLAAHALTDTQLNLPALAPKLPLEAILKYRDDHPDELERAREELAWLAREIRQTPWSAGFAKEMDSRTIPEIRRKLDEGKRARDSWLKSRRGRLSLKATGVTVGAAAATISLVFSPTPQLPVAVAAGVLGLASSAAIPALDTLLEWLEGKREATQNGLLYLVKFQGGRS